MTWRAAIVAILKALAAGLWGFLEKRKLQEKVNDLQEEKREAAVAAAHDFKETVEAVLDEKPASTADVDAVRKRLLERAERNSKAAP